VVSETDLVTKTAAELNVDGKALRVTNLGKVLYPEVGFTKGQVLDYYLRIAPVILPYLKDHPLTLKRYPEGVNAGHFYEKQCPSYRPPWLKLKAVPREHRTGEVNYCVVDSRPGLIWVANLASLELHILLSRREDINRPTTMVFDLDPGPPATVLDSARIALRLRSMLKELGLESFPKTSGGKGLHVYVPLNTPITYDDTKRLSHALAEVLERENPDQVVSKMSKGLRRGKVFVDWSQNDDHKTTICVYSLRAMDRPTVSTPVTWNELETAIKRSKPEALVFETEAVFQRLEEHGDLFEPVLQLKQRLPALVGNGARLPQP
jgi:bifunctional non-homologous end joining protein LigD